MDWWSTVGLVFGNMSNNATTINLEAGDNSNGKSYHPSSDDYNFFPNCGANNILGMTNNNNNNTNSNTNNIGPKTSGVDDTLTTGVDDTGALRVNNDDDEINETVHEGSQDDMHTTFVKNRKTMWGIYEERSTFSIKFQCYKHIS